jgi:Eco29kI restriction endonuclease
MPASADFRLSITLALTSQLRDALASLTPVPLTRANLDALERRKGVYQLYHRGTLVYVGSAKTRLPTRLGQHLRKISGRENIDLADMAFTCLYVEEDMTVLSPEHNLMEGFKADGFCAWNYNGFGNKDPGVERDTTVLDPDHWDITYPVDLSLPVGAIAAGEHDLEAFMKELKGELPFNFRYQKKGPAIADYAGLRVTVPASGMTARRLFEAIVAVLPAGWHAWVLPGYVILYKNDRDYPQGRRIQP